MVRVTLPTFATNGLPFGIRGWHSTRVRVLTWVFCFRLFQSFLRLPFRHNGKYIFALWAKITNICFAGPTRRRGARLETLQMQPWNC